MILPTFSGKLLNRLVVSVVGFEVCFVEGNQNVFP